jgi:hypothetical protein
MESYIKSSKVIGALLIAGAVALLIPYTVLTIIFEYPDVLRQDPAIILTKFHKGGPTLIWTWFAFAVVGLPLIPAFVLMGQQLENKMPFVRLATSLGVIGLVVQMIGLLRWTFVVPVLADIFVNATNEATRTAALISFKTVHQFAGVMLGEHVGQLFSIIWTILMTMSFVKLRLFSKWIHVLGLISSLIYLMAQAELFGTVVPNLPVWEMAGFVGSTLWLLWLIIIGYQFLTLKFTFRK